MSSENITQALTTLRTVIDTKIDESLAGPKTVDQMITAVNSIASSSGETEETPQLCLLYLPCEKEEADKDVLKTNEFVFGSMRFARVLPLTTDPYSTDMFYIDRSLEWVETKAPFTVSNYVYNLKGQPEDEDYAWGTYRALSIPLGVKLLLNDFTIDFFIRKNFTFYSEMMILSFESNSGSYNLSFIGPNKIKLSLVNDNGEQISGEGEIDTTIFNDNSFIYLRFERFGNKFSVYTTANPLTSYENTVPSLGVPETDIVKFIDLECPLTNVQDGPATKTYFGDFTRFCDWYLNKVRVFNYSITNHPNPWSNGVTQDCYLAIEEEWR